MGSEDKKEVGDRHSEAVQRVGGGALCSHFGPMDADNSQKKSFTSDHEKFM